MDRLYRSLVANQTLLFGFGGAACHLLLWLDVSQSLPGWLNVSE